MNMFVVTTMWGTGLTDRAVATEDGTEEVDLRTGKKKTTKIMRKF